LARLRRLLGGRAGARPVRVRRCPGSLCPAEGGEEVAVSETRAAG